MALAAGIPEPGSGRRAASPLGAQGPGAGPLGSKSARGSGESRSIARSQGPVMCDPLPSAQACSAFASLAASTREARCRPGAH